MKNVIIALVFYLVIGFLWLSYSDMEGLKNWMSKAVITLSILGMLNTLFLGLLSLKPFAMPALNSPLKTVVQIIMVDGLFLLLRKMVERTLGTDSRIASFSYYFSSPESQFALAYVVCFLVMLLTRKWWRMNWEALV